MPKAGCCCSSAIRAWARPSCSARPRGWPGRPGRVSWRAPARGCEVDCPRRPLQRLGVQDAGRLVDAQPQTPGGRAREQVLAKGAGTRLALVELAKAIAADPGAGRRWFTEPLPPTGRLTA